MIDDNAGMTETLLAHELPRFCRGGGDPSLPRLPCCLCSIGGWAFMPDSHCNLHRHAFPDDGREAGKVFSRYQRAVEDLSAEATEYVQGIPVVKVFQQTVYSFKSFYSSIMSYSKLASEYAMVNRTPHGGFYNGPEQHIPSADPGGDDPVRVSADGWGVLVDLVFYILFTPLCAMMINRLMYAGQASMEAAEAVYKARPDHGGSAAPGTGEPLNSPRARTLSSGM